MTINEAITYLLDNNYIIEGLKSDLESGAETTKVISVYENILNYCKEHIIKDIELIRELFNSRNNPKPITWLAPKDIWYKNIPLYIGFIWDNDGNYWASCGTATKYKKTAVILLNLSPMCRNLHTDDIPEVANSLYKFILKFKDNIQTSLTHEYRHYIDYANKYYNSGNKYKIHNKKVTEQNKYWNLYTEINAFIVQEIPNLIKLYQADKLNTNDDINVFFKKYLADDIDWESMSKDTKKKISNRLFKIVKTVQNEKIKDMSVKEAMRWLYDNYDFEIDEKNNTGKHYKICKNCGEKLDKDSKYCTECGEKN